MEPGKQEKEVCELHNVESWTEEGWTKLYRVIRHPLAPHKKMFRIVTSNGIVDVTDDHSLLNVSGKEISPNGWSKYSKTDALQHIPDSNFWHYSLQLNMYKYILETKYDKVVSNICLVKLHPNNKSQTYEIISLPILKKEMEEMF